MPCPDRPYIIPIFISHLGCPFHCLYCQQERITGQEEWLPTRADISAKVTCFLETRRPGKYSHAEVAFYGGTFTGLKQSIIEEMLGAVLPFVESGQVQSLRASTKPDFIFPEMFPLLKKFRLDTIELGVQSLDDEVLRKVGRGYDRATVRRAVLALKSGGFRVGIQLMQGLPGGSEEEALASAREAIALGPDFVRLYPTVVLKGTGLERRYRDGKYLPWELSQAIQVCKRLKSLFAEAEIPIIKLGLEFSTDEREGIVAGPYHPQFHQLVS